MEFNSGVSMFLPDSIGLLDNDYDEEDQEDMVHEQTNQNEIVELIMAAFEGHDEPSDGEDDEDEDEDESLNNSNTSHQSANEHEILNTNNNNNNNTSEHYPQQHESRHRPHHYQQPLFSTPAVSTPPPLVPQSVSSDNRRFEDHTQYTHSQYPAFDEHNTTNEQELPFRPKSATHLHYQNANRSLSASASAAVQYFDSLPTVDLIDPMQTQFMYQTSSANLPDTQNQLNKFRILCNVKERKITELENRCAEYLEKYNSDVRALKHRVELSERAKYDSDQRYQSITNQCEELIETNNQLHRTVKDTELRIQQLESNKVQLEKKLDEAESLIDSLHRKVNELQRFESIARTQQDCELVLASAREKHEQELINVNEKLQMTQMNLQEKDAEVDELRVQLESACKNNEKAIYERMETINHLNQQLHDCQRQYTDLLTTKSMDTFNQTDTKRQLTRMAEEKEKLEQTCEDLQSEIRTLRERLGVTEHEVNNDLFGLSAIGDNELSSTTRQVVPHNSTSFDNPNESLLTENHHLKERIDEFASNEKNLIEVNEDLQRQIHQLTQKERNEHEEINSLNKEIDQFRKDYAELKDKFHAGQQQSQKIIDQLREDIVDLDKTKQLYIDVCHEKNSIEDKLRLKFEHEIKVKLDELHRTLEKDFDERMQECKNNYQQRWQSEEDQLTERHAKDIERMKIQQEKAINELNLELDRLRANNDAKSRLVYIEKEFEQLKDDYYDLNVKQKELLSSCSTLEQENQTLLRTIDDVKREKSQLQDLNDQQREELRSLEKQTDGHQVEFTQNLASLQTRINNYENAVSQYEEYRLKLESNLQRITQQRDTNKMDLRLTREMLSNKETEFDQVKLHLDQCEKNLQVIKERSETTIHELQQEIHELNQIKLKELQEKEAEYRERLSLLETEKNQSEQRLQDAHRALNLADSHLKQEIEKIKNSLEQEYNRRYERDQKQHQQELTQLRQQLTSEFEKQKSSSSIIIQSNTSAQDVEEVKKMYRTEIDRLYRENIDLSQNHAKLIDTHQKQMQIMKKDLDDGYNNVINDFQHEQARLQARCEQLKQQYHEGQQTIEHMQRSHANELLIYKEKSTSEQDNRNRQENLQNRIEHLMNLLEQANNTLNDERAVHSKQDNDYQQAISALQKKIAEMIKQHTKAVDEIKRELHQERLSSQKQLNSRPISVPEFVQTDLSVSDIRSDYMATIEKLRELFTLEMLALLRLTCKMIFDVHHRVGIAHYTENLDGSVKKQIQNELVRSRNSMIKEIRRELFEKMTHAMKSQGVPDNTIDMHVFELDRLLSQMAQDCLDSLSASSSSSSSLYATITSNSSSLSTPQRQSSRVVVYDSSLSNLTKSRSPEMNSTPLRKSVESLYTTPINGKQAAPLAPHCHVTLDSDRRPKSASTILLASQSSTTPTVLSPRAHKFQRPSHKNFKMKMYRSEDDIMLAVQRQEEQQQAQQKSELNEDDDTLTLGDNDKDDPTVQPNVRALARQFEQKTGSLPEHNRSKLKSPENHPAMHHATARTIISEQQEEVDDDRLSWPQQSPTTPTSSGGIKKFVRNGLKLLTAQPQQQHKKSGK